MWYTYFFYTSQDTPWCTAETPADTSPAAVNAITDDGMQGAWIPANAVWPWKEKEIYVEFRNVELLSKWTINNGQTMNTVTVLHYANKWNRIGGGDIPSFVEAENGKQAHIRVSFNSTLFHCNRPLHNINISYSILMVVILYEQ